MSEQNAQNPTLTKSGSGFKTYPFGKLYIHIVLTIYISFIIMSS
jgi:hypothetical protein